ncbi:MAG TPA: homoserine dehydrogenase [Candidatus Limnocylindrales bacterium]|jgi:homoserine dehydrogenase
MTLAPLRVALLGAGTVGREVAQALLDRSAELLPADGSALVLTGIAVRDLDRARSAGLPADLLTDAPAHLVASADTDVIVELMGGDEPARTLISAALASGKAVVTANKHVIAHHGPALEDLARRSDAALRFEAAVGGGIPILGPLATDLFANRIGRVRGIVNGTTNFILSAMTDEGRAYADALAAAQAAGYAEADPSGDVEGHDAVNKLVILARLAFGRWIDAASVATVPETPPGAGSPGITGVTAADLAAARAAGQVVKLVADAHRDGDRIAASVLPTFVDADSPLGGTPGVLNRIEVEATPLGTVAFSGPGAGGPATSSAILGDLVALARGLGSTWAGLPAATVAEPAVVTPAPAVSDGETAAPTAAAATR